MRRPTRRQMRRPPARLLRRPPVAAAALLAIALAAAGCAAAPAAKSDTGLDSRLAGQWVLDRASDKAGTILGVYATLTIGRGTASRGRGPCTDYSARIVGEPGAVFVSAAPESGSHCPDPILGRLDARYLKALRDSDLATVTTDSLSLQGTSSKLTFRRAPYVSAADFVDVVWNAKTETFGNWEGKRFADVGPTVTTEGNMVLSKDGSFSAEVNGCGPAIGTWTIEAGEVVVRRGTDAPIHCSVDADSARLNGLLAAVDDGFQFSRASDTLLVSNPRTLDTIAFTLPPKIVF